MCERTKLALVMCAALIQGLGYLALLPPWQHYDEPTHFEYAALIARQGWLSVARQDDRPLRHAIAESMLEHGFYRNLPKPDLSAPNGPVEIGFEELGHPPVYYLLASLPLRLAGSLDVTAQLYLARTVSLVLFLLTILVSAGIIRELTPPGHTLRWAVPLTVALVGPFVDVMTSVNNDAGAVFFVSWFLWLAVRLVRFGPTLLRLVFLAAVALLAVFTKNTASVVVFLAPNVVIIALFVWYRWRWRWLVLSGGALCVLAGASILDSGDAAYWYRWSITFVQSSAVRTTDPAGPFGSHILETEAVAPEQFHELLSPILDRDVVHLAGRPVTIGGWVWADRPAAILGPGLALSRRGSGTLELLTHGITVTTTPRFVAWTFAVPAETEVLHYALFGNSVEAREAPFRVRLAGALLVAGSWPGDSAPVFDDAKAHSGLWNGQRFTNLVRNPSGEEPWPRLRPWFERVFVSYIHRSPALVFAALLDVQRTRVFLLQTVLPQLTDGLFNGFSWGQIRLAGFAWSILFRSLLLIGLVGSLKWVLWSRSRPRGVRPAVFLLGLAGLIVVVNTVLRPLPMLEAKVLLPAARYAFPAIVPVVLMLTGGWWVLWPRPYRRYGIWVLLAMIICLDLASIWTIWTFYQSRPGM